MDIKKAAKKTYKEVQKELQRMFWEQWDPIGVNNDPRAEGEYDAYANEVCNFMINTPDVDESKIHEYLHRVMHDYMGLSPDADLENKTERFEKELILLWQRVTTKT